LKSNDSQELKLLLNTIKPIYEEISNSFTGISPSDAETLSSMISNYFTFSSSTRSMPLVMSFSKKRDSLDQWRGYGDDGKGICIGVEAELLQSLACGNSMLYCDDVKYLDSDDIKDEFRELIRQAITDFVETIKGMVRKNGKLSLDDIVILHGKLFPDNFVKKAMFTKSTFFETEEEYRITMLLQNVATSDPNVFINSTNRMLKRLGSTLTLKPFNIGIRSQQLVEYVDIDTQKQNELIREVIIGPKSVVTDRDIKIFLAHNGFDLTGLCDDAICKSSGSYR
jgi:hypothetical protein